MLLALPFVFVPFIISFPVGLMIYWVTTNLWTVGQGIVTRRLFPGPCSSCPRSRVGLRAKQPAGTQPTAKPKPARAVVPEQTPPATPDGPAQPRPVRRRKKKGPRTRR